MVNLNRQIGVSQARQGGFSAHVLPEPVGYQLDPGNVVYSDGTTTQSTGVLTATEAGRINTWTGVNCSFAFPSVQHSAAGGPFGEPYFPALGDSAECGDRSFGRIYYTTLNGAAIGQADTWTWEMWYRWPNQTARVTGRYNSANLNTYSEQPTENTLRFYPSGTVGSSFALGNVTRNIWRHLAYVHDAEVLSVYDHGSRVLEEPTSAWGLSALVFTDGGFFMEAGSHCDIGQARLTLDNAVYSGATITPPTAPFIAV